MPAVAPNINTPNGIIADAMFEAKLLQLGDNPTSEQLVMYSRRLLELINTWQVTGLRLWLNVDTAVTLVSGQNSYTFKPSGNIDMVKPLRVLQGYYLVTASGVRRPITVLSWNDWLLLSTTTQEGQVSQYFVDKQVDQLKVYFWLTPDDDAAADGTAHVLLQTQVTNFTELDETVNFPLEWRLALKWGLAAEICNGQPQDVVTMCQGKAAFYKDILDGWDVEDAPTSFQLDSRMGQQSGRFK